MEATELHEASPHLGGLNEAQRAAVVYGVQRGEPGHGSPALLIIAGAGTGKTATLTHRVAHLLLNGADPHRILLLTFARRAAAEMTRRVEDICARAVRGRPAVRVHAIEWSGTFHAVGARLLRLHAESIGLDPSFSICDRADAEDLMDVVRTDLGYAGTRNRFPKKGTCLSIYSHVVNAQARLRETLARAYPWCTQWEEDLGKLFGAYVAAKQAQGVLDYDDLLLYWAKMMELPGIGALVAARFDHVLVDEYQDTNVLQASILRGLRPNGCGLTVVGDDAQSIYSFRSASVRNILDFPTQFDPPAHVAKLEQNYRSTQPILAACNAVIAEASEGFAKTLYSKRTGGAKPALAMVADDAAQVEYVIDRILVNREAGMALRDQAVLMRASHHASQLEVELTRRNIPYVKYGGLKFLEAAHVKDVIAILRWAENPRDDAAGMRVLKLLPSVGPALARRALGLLHGGTAGFTGLRAFSAPHAAAEGLAALGDLMDGLTRTSAWPGDLDRVRHWYDPILADRYDNAHTRRGDLDQLEAMSTKHPSRVSFLTDIALDPPEAVGGEAGPPVKDEDWLILSTIHSAKGQEWRAVYVLNVVDGCIPSDLATGSTEEIEEERRLLYVAMSRARDDLVLMQPMRFYIRGQAWGSDRHVYAPRSRFVLDEHLRCFDVVAAPAVATTQGAPAGIASRVDLKEAVRRMW
jgi:DNA helicase-2/ATP-dependent DNA helicase PcrA